MAYINMSPYKDVKVYAYTFRGNNSIVFVLAFLLKGVSSLRKKFAPSGANLFLQEQTPIWNFFCSSGDSSCGKEFAPSGANFL